MHTTLSEFLTTLDHLSFFASIGIFCLMALTVVSCMLLAQIIFESLQ